VRTSSKDFYIEFYYNLSDDLVADIGLQTDGQTAGVISISGYFLLLRNERLTKRVHKHQAETPAGS
jgi:hypothetical protein